MTMSLFHNLKLKRRKIDTSSNSDGKFTMISAILLYSSSVTKNGFFMTVQGFRDARSKSGWKIAIQQDCNIL